MKIQSLPARSTLTLLAGCLMLVAVLTARSQTNFTVLKSFGNASNQLAAGFLPYAGLIQASNGWLYGTTWAGGTNIPTTGGGTIFKMLPDGTGYTVLRDFAGSDGRSPYPALLEASDGMLYGTTYEGGISNNGTVFKLSPSGDSFAVLHHFTGGSDSKNPYAALIEGDDGYLYGTTYFGDAATRGTIYKLDKSGSNYAIIHVFTGNPDGQQTKARLLKANDGVLYGTTYYGGESVRGTIFRMNQDGGTYIPLSLFSVANGYSPNFALIQASDGFLYGTTQLGGNGGGGTIFRFNTLTLALTVIYNFTNSGTALRTSSSELVEGGAGFLYGLTGSGGAYGRGGIFKVKKDGTEFTVLREFAGTSGNGDGEQPVALVRHSDDLFYGTAFYGGKTSLGCLFALSTTAFAPRALSLSLGGSSSTIQFSGTAAVDYSVLTSTNLVGWSTWTNIVAPNHGEVTLTNNTPSQPAKFYRARLH